VFKTGDPGGASTSTSSDTSGNNGGGGGGGGNGGGGGGGGSSTTSNAPVNIPGNALATMPEWLIQSGYINSLSALQGSDLQRMIDTANARFGLSSQQIANSLQNAQRNVTYDLANRQATESGDNAFYHNQASLLASFQQQGAQIDLNDYLAGAQAAYQEQQLTNQTNLSQDWLDNFNNAVSYYTQLAGGGAPTPAVPPQPGAPSG
jgi:hypothetical protein